LTKDIAEFPHANLKVGVARMGSLTVELIEYRAPRGAASQTLVLNDVGSPYLAFITDDIQRDYERLRAMGVPFKTDPGYNPKTGVHAVYGYDPDGSAFELVQRD
jgi:catechol 2,3-dioxygenase-like lactoylglutathione lyase family enzyme